MKREVKLELPASLSSLSEAELNQNRDKIFVSAQQNDLADSFNSHLVWMKPEDLWAADTCDYMCWTELYKPLLKSLCSFSHARSGGRPPNESLRGNFP